MELIRMNHKLFNLFIAATGLTLDEISAKTKVNRATLSLFANNKLTPSKRVKDALNSLVTPRQLELLIEMDALLDEIIAEDGDC